MAETEGLSSTKDYRYDVLRLVNSSGQAIDIQDIVLETVLYQSIDAPAMWGTLLVSDVKDIINNFRITGNEYLQMELTQPSLGDSIKKNFRVFKIDRRTRNGGGALYALNFVSNSQLVSNSSLISKAYKGKTCRDIVEDILKNYMGIERKDIHRIEYTTGTFDFIIPSYRPIEAINWVCSRSFDADKKFNYMFYESSKGYEFISLQTLYKGRGRIRNLRYDIKSVNDAPNTPSDISKNRNSLEKFTIIQDFDTLAASRTGAFAGSVLAVNVHTRSYKRYNYGLETAQNQKRLLNDYAPTNDKHLMNSFLTNAKTYIDTSNTAGVRSNEVDKWLINRQLHSNLIGFLKIGGTVSGDITMLAGDIVNFEFPKFTVGDESTKDMDEYRSGKYMISQIIHVITQSKFETNIEMVSDSYSEPLPTAKKLK